MTQEEKAKAYERALAKARDFNFQGYMDEECLYDMFPELREPEDEKIREWLINWAKAVNWSEQFIITKEQVLAWLEKHKYTQRDVDDAYLKGFTDTKKVLGNQGEQVWSEDDEDMAGRIRDALKGTRYNYYYKDSIEMIDWLQSIKQRLGGK